MNDLRNFWNSGPFGKLMIAGVGLLLLCCVCSVPILLVSPGTSFLAPLETAFPAATQVIIPTPIIPPTDTPVVSTPELILTETPQLVTPDTGCAFCSVECPASQEGIDFCVVDTQLAADQSLFEATLRSYCEARGTDFCKVLVWTDAQSVPSSLPMTDQQLVTQVADYSRDQASGVECLLLLSGGEVVFQSEECN